LQQPLPNAERFFEKPSKISRVTIHAAADIPRGVRHAPTEPQRLDPPAEGHIVHGIAAHGRMAAEPTVDAPAKQHVLADGRRQRRRSTAVSESQRQEGEDAPWNDRHDQPA
jgi:hypothetical protein